MAWRTLDERGILHRDLKPANILLTDDGQPMLLDFNLATNLRPTANDERVRNGGTFPYMAPEQLEATLTRALAVDCRSDLYALGVLLFELLTSRHPFEQPSGKLTEVVAKMLAQPGRPARSAPVQWVHHASARGHRAKTARPGSGPALPDCAPVAGRPGTAAEQSAVEIRPRRVAEGAARQIP